MLLPGFLRRDLERHLDWYAEKWQDGVLFVEERGKLRKARAAVALLVGFRFYDLRHTGHTLATRSGATLKDTMVRAGQSSERAALIYHHSDLEPQQEVAGVLDDLVRANPCEGQGETFWCGSGARRLNCSGQ